MKKFRCIYDGDSFIDGIDCETFEQAKALAEDILCDWEAEVVDDEEHDYMVYNCMTWAEEYDEDTGTWNDIWYPSDEFLKSIGWVERTV